MNEYFEKIANKILNGNSTKEDIESYLKEVYQFGYNQRQREEFRERCFD